jgi:hypothetical protein
MVAKACVAEIQSKFHFRDCPGVLGAKRRSINHLQIVVTVGYFQAVRRRKRQCSHYNREAVCAQRNNVTIMIMTFKRACRPKLILRTCLHAG